MKAIVQEVFDTKDGYWEVVAQTKEGKVARCYVEKSCEQPKKGDELTLYYRGTTVVYVELNGKNVYHSPCVY